MRIKEIGNKYILRSLKSGIISKEIAIKLIEVYNFDGNTLKYIHINPINKLIYNILNDSLQRNTIKLENYNRVKEDLIEFSNMINYYEKQHLIVIDTKKVIYKKQMFCNDVSSNCYIFISNGEAVMIDAGIKLDEILMCLGKLNVKLKYILITHGYIDHIFSACEIKNSTGAKIVFSNNDIITIEKNYSKDFSVKDVDKFVDNHDVLKLNGVEIKVIEAPGHTIGSVCYKIDQYLFTGDTLLKSKVGISDDGRFYTKTIDSIKTKLFPLEDQMIIDSQKLEY